jgi:hypothetical protein
MPAPLGPLVGFSLGVVLAWLGRAAADTDAPRGRPRPTLLVSLFATLVFAPACGYFIVFAGDWSLAYLFDSRAIPSAVELLLIAADAASVLAGFETGRRVIRRRALRAAAALAAAPLVPALLFLVLFYSRLRIEGTYHQVRSDFGTQPVAGGPLGYALLWMNAALVAGFALTTRLLLERKFRPSAAPPRAPAPGPRVTQRGPLALRKR